MKSIKSKKFKAPNGKPDIRVALLSGHVCIIGRKFRDLPEHFWQEAYSKGAISEDMADSKTFDEAVSEKKKEIEEKKVFDFNKLKDILLDIYNNPIGNIDKNGFPLHRKVTISFGGPIHKALIRKAWEDVKMEQENK